MARRQITGRLLLAIIFVTLGFTPIFSELPIVLAQEVETGAESGVQVESDNLYEELGEIAGITQMVNGFLSDERMGISFPNNNMKRFRVATLSHLICQLADGPCHYGGANIGDVLQELGVLYNDIYVALQPLEDGLYKAGISLERKEALFALLLPITTTELETVPEAATSGAKDTQ